MHKQLNINTFMPKKKIKKLLDLYAQYATV